MLQTLGLRMAPDEALLGEFWVSPVWITNCFMSPFLKVLAWLAEFQLSASKSLFQRLVACRNIALAGSHRCFLLHLSVYNMYRKEVFRIIFSISMQESSVSCQVSSPGWCMSTRIHLGTIPRNAQCTCRVITLTSVWLPSFLLFQTILDWMPNRGISRNSGTGAVAARAQHCTTTIIETI